MFLALLWSLASPLLLLFSLKEPRHDGLSLRLKPLINLSDDDKEQDPQLPHSLLCSKRMLDFVVSSAETIEVIWPTAASDNKCLFLFLLEDLSFSLLDLTSDGSGSLCWEKEDPLLSQPTGWMEVDWNQLCASRS